MSIQYQQLFNLTVLFILGKFFLNLPLSWLEMGVIILFAAAIEHILIYIRDKKITFFSPSWIISGMGVWFMIKTPFLLLYLWLITLSILQKYILRYNWKPIFNPSNFGVCIWLLLFPGYVYVFSEQWWNLWYFSLIFIGLGTYTLYRANKLTLALTYLFFYAVFSYLFITHNVVEVFSILISWALLQFTYFMITDPRTSPVGVVNQVLFSFILVGLLFVLHRTIWVWEGNIFLSLFIVSIFWFFQRVCNIPEKKWYLWSIVILWIMMIWLYMWPKQFQSTSIWELQERTSILSIISPYDIPRDVELYLSNWSTSKVIERPIVPQENTSTHIFTPENHFKEYFSNENPIHLGADYLFASAWISSGDINQDGLLDIIFSKVNKPIAIYLNQWSNNFIDVTSYYFSEIPFWIEQIALVDMDNDSHLDMMVIPSKYREEKKNIIYFYDNNTLRFDTRTPFYFWDGRKSFGWLWFIDLNQDGILDYYLSNGNDNNDPRKWESQYLVPQKDELYISNGRGNWSNRLNDYVGKELGESKYAGMTVQFSDLNRDGIIDLLVWNDVWHPSLTYFWYKLDGLTKFKLIDKDQIEFNCKDSMSYISVDIDNDGFFELWENCISFKNIFTDIAGEFRWAYPINEPDPDTFLSELISVQKWIEVKNINCNAYSNIFIRMICNQKWKKIFSEFNNDKELCESIENIDVKNICLAKFTFQKSNPNDITYDPENFPKQLRKNPLLKWNDKKYVNILKNDELSFSKFSWGAFPYDIDNNGFVDIYVTNGYAHALSRDRNTVLMNYWSHDFKEEWSKLWIGSLEEGRWVIIEDFDLDGDGDIIVNNNFSSPEFFENNFWWDSVQVDLRSTGNYYALWSILELHTDTWIYTRQIINGGSWNTANSSTQSFGIPKGTSILYLKVFWPDNTESIHQNIERNNRYIIYQ